MHPVLRCRIFSHHAVVHQLLYLHPSADELPCLVRSMPLAASTVAATALAPAAVALAPAARSSSGLL